MKLSVVMAVRDGEAFLRDAMESVLNQSFADFEFLIVDDASVDSTPVVLEEYQRRDSRVSVLRNAASIGPYGSANRALMAARGDVVARHDADDTSPPDRFAIQLNALESAADVTLVIGAIEEFQAGDGATTMNRPPAWQPQLEWELLFSNVVGAGAHVMFPRVVHGTPVLFPARHPYAEDYGLWCRLARMGRVVCPPQTVYRYRRHDGSISHRHKTQQDQYMTEIRYEYQVNYLGSAVSIEDVSEVSRFWLRSDGSLPIRLDRIDPILIRLRTRFLDYVAQRYGLGDREVLEGHLDREFVERLGYWLARSIRLHDARAARAALAMAGKPRRMMNASGHALGRAAGAALRRLTRHRADRHGARS